MNAALGTSVTSATGSPGPGSLSNTETCNYSGGTVSLYYAAGENTQAFQTAVSSLNGATPVSGLGTSAYSDQSSNSDPNQYQVLALFGSFEISVTADATVTQEAALLQTIDSQL